MGNTAENMVSSIRRDELKIPHPPMCVSRAEDALYAGEPVIVNLASGDKGIGKLMDFDPKAGTLKVQYENDEHETEISFADLKIMHLPELRQWVKLETRSPENDKALSPETDRQDFEIVFRDDDVLEGTSHGFKQEQFGIHLFPIQHNNQYIHTFIPNGFVKKSRVGPLIGEMLVESELVSARDLESVIADQEKTRNQPLGELLKSSAVVTSKDLEMALERQKSAPNMRLGEILVSESLVTEKEIEDALEAQKEDRSKALGEILVERGLVSTADIQRSLAKKLCIPFVDLGKFHIEAADARMLPENIVRQHKVVPLYSYNGKLVVAMENPMDWKVIDELSFHVNLHVEPVIAAINDIENCIAQLYAPGGLLDDSMGEIEFSLDDLDHVYDEPEELDDDSYGSSEIEDNVIVKLAKKIITDAYNMGASDIHIEPGRGKAKSLVRVRKDGSLLNYKEISPAHRDRLIARLKVMANLDVAERRIPQDGKIDFSRFSRLKIELRVATMPTVGGMEDVVIRILASGEPMPIDKLGLSERNYKSLNEVISRPYGLFFVCGPTGTGKTTTLHSVLGRLNVDDRKIWTAEDPVEITQKGLRQVQVNPKVGLTFAAAMRSFLRADPDIIMIGEMRDKETVKTCIEASLTGHMILSTLHTNTATESITRLLDMGMEPYNFADAVVGILAQRLTKSLCPSCKKSYTPDEDELETMLLDYCDDLFVKDGRTNNGIKSRTLKEWKQRYTNKDGNFRLFKACGCEECAGTGYSGRMAVHELLVATDEVKHGILTGMPVLELQALALSQGMRTLKQDGIEKVLQGHTDMMQVRKVCIR